MCPSCGKQELPVTDWFLYGSAECRSCHKVAVTSPSIIKLLWRTTQITLVLLVLLVLVYPKLVALSHVYTVTIIGVLMFLLVPKLFRPVPYTEGSRIDFSRSQRFFVLALLFVVVAFLVGLLYWSLASS